MLVLIIKLWEWFISPPMEVSLLPALYALHFELYLCKARSDITAQTSMIAVGKCKVQSSC